MVKTGDMKLVLCDDGDGELYDMSLRIENGRFAGVERCFQSGPYVEDLRDILRQVSDQELHLRSFTSRKQAYLEDPTKAIICSLDADPNAKLVFTFKKPAELTVEVPVQELIHDNRIAFTGVFTTESFVIHRLVSEQASKAQVRWEDARSDKRTADQYHIRVRQHSNHWAWSSPIWVG
jgi:hypothetical protein